MEKITAVVVTYNRKELLKRTIECLRSQTRTLDSIIVVNNSSTDGTAEIAEKAGAIVKHEYQQGMKTD